MDFFKIISQLAEVDADVLDRFDTRRAVFNSLGTAAKRTAMAATPLFLGALFNKAYAGDTSVKASAVDVLNYALALELLEADFYSQLITAGQIPAGTPAVAALAKIKTHEDQHVALLGGTNGTGGAIRGLGGTPVSGIRFKASAIPNFATDYDTQLLVAQVLEDTGVRAYKGRAGELIGTDLLTTALQIHSMEARHASHIRYMRSNRPNGTNIRPWITAADSQLAAPAGPAYTSGTTGTVPTSFTFGAGTFAIPAYTAASPREDNVTQSGVNLTSALGTTYSADDAAAAFDEYLQAAEVLDASRAGGLVA
jgi:hypothetical protein